MTVIVRFLEQWRDAIYRATVYNSHKNFMLKSTAGHILGSDCTETNKALCLGTGPHSVHNYNVYIHLTVLANQALWGGH